MKIKQALPGILKRSSPIVRPEYPLLTVLYLLRMTGADVVPVTFMNGMSGRAVYGCSVLFKATQTGPAGLANILREPCLAASDELSMVSEEDDIEALLSAFKLKRLGFAFVHSASDPMRGRVVSLADVLSLYPAKIIATGMTLEDVSSDVVSIEGELTLREALKMMYHHSYRRTFLTGEQGCIFDRQIMDHVFSPNILEGPDPEQLCRDLLARPVTHIKKTTPDTIDRAVPIPKAAARLVDATGGCLMVGDRRLVTPWDVVMKPWAAGELEVA